MENLTGDISNMVFSPVSSENLGDVSLDGQMLKLLVELDGKRSLGAVAQALDMNLATARTVITKLLELNLAIKTERLPPLLDREFVNFLKTQLNQATGPISEVLLEDVVDEMGMELAMIPVHRATELVDLLSRQIPREENALAFKEAMVKKILEIES
jgi:hypothetical protein